MHAVATAKPDDLRLIPYLALLPAQDAAAIAAALPVATYAPREVVILQGDPVPGIFLTVGGRGRLFMTSGEGKEHTLRVLSRGDTFAEVPAFDSGPSPATVESLDHLTVVVLPRDTVRNIMRAYPEVADAVLLYFARRLRGFTSIIEQVSLQTVTARLARYLYQTARVEGVATAGGISVRRQVTVHDLATIVGSVREVVTRYLKDMESQGLITVTRKEFIIHDMEALQELL